MNWLLKYTADDSIQTLVETWVSPDRPVLLMDQRHLLEMWERAIFG